MRDGNAASRLADYVQHRRVSVEGDDVVVRLAGAWRRWRYDECFIQLVPLKVSRRLAKRGVTPPQLAQLVEE